jgi:ubiquinone/menaquinone biosynthesis C-methylase UbiE
MTIAPDLPTGATSMPHGADQEYLLTQQYRDASNLNARMQLHERFSTNRRGWHSWMFDHLQLPAEARLLEVGCGPGALWRENRDRIPAGWAITLSDFSPGMLREAEQHLAGGQPGFRFARLDAQAIPFAAASFDAVIANHMLYHVPDRPKALGEIRRVLRPGGHFYAATNGQNHMRELHALATASLDGAPAGDPALHAEQWTHAFSLENGREALAPFFSNVTLQPYPDALVVTEAEPLIAYARSGRYQSLLVGDRLAAFASAVEREIARRGALRITKEIGLFEAW